MREIIVAARSSPLSKAQVEEVMGKLNVPYKTLFVETTGDKNKIVSLRSISKSDPFFTKEVDELVYKGVADVAIHSAKDLPEPIQKGLKVIALTTGISEKDSLVMRQGESLKPGMKIGASSVRREDNIKTLCPKLQFIDIRGTIEERLKKLESNELDGVVVAEAALIRLKLTHLNRIDVPGTSTPFQGRLAVLAKNEFPEFLPVDARPRILYTGLRCPSPLFHHHPTIRIAAVPFTPPKRTGFLLLTSQSAIEFFDPYIDLNMKAICVGKATALAAQSRGLDTIIANEESQEGVVELLKAMGVNRLIWPRSTMARPVISNFCKEHDIELIEIPVYKPEPIKIDVALEDFDEIIFTSPSTLGSIDTLPKGIRIRALGHVTESALRNKFGSDLMIEKGVPYGEI